MKSTALRSATPDRLREVAERAKRAIVFDVAAGLMVVIGFAGGVLGLVSL